MPISSTSSVLSRGASLPPYLYKSSMPNLCQTDNRSKTLREGELVYCVPVAVSNILIHLAKQHFRFIVPALGKLDETEAQLKLVDELAKLMGTTDENGTEYEGMEEGLERYVRDRGYKIKFFSQIYEKQTDFNPKVISSPSEIMPYVVGTSNALLYVDFAKFIPELKKYKHILFHGVALAGFVNNGTPELIIHDPSPATEREPRRCRLFPIQDGTLYGWHKQNSLNAAGFNELEGIGIDTPEILQGANKIVLYGIQSFKVYRK